MNQEEIVKLRDKAYNDIRAAEILLEYIREKCNHENTYEGNYMYRPGSVIYSEICSDCGKSLKDLSKKL